MRLKATRKLSALARCQRRYCARGVSGRNTGWWRGDYDFASGRHCGRPPDCPPDSGIGSTATDVRDCRIDIPVGGVGIDLQQQRGGHDHPGLAIAALWHAFRGPGLLDRVAPIARKAFDCCYHRAFKRSDRDLARPHGAAIHIDRTRSAIPGSAAIFCSGQVRGIAQRPEQGRLRIHPVFNRLVIDGELGQDALPALLAALLHDCAQSFEPKTPAQGVRARNAPDWDRMTIGSTFDRASGSFDIGPRLIGSGVGLPREDC